MSTRSRTYMYDRGALQRAVRSVASLTAAALWCLGCAVAGDEPADPVGEKFSDLESAAFCAGEGTDEGHGILALVNDPRVTFEVLDDPVSTGNAGLNSNAAAGIIDARPFARLAELDAVPFVGASACGALRDFACEVRGLCEPPLVTLSWNVEQFPLTGETLEEVALQIEELDPDVIGFQEIRDRVAFDALVDRLEEYEAHVGRGDGFTQVALLTRADRIEIGSVTDLFVDDRSAFPRAPVHAELTARAGSFDVPFDFTVLHLKALEDSESRERRRDACEALRGLLDDRAGEGAPDAVLVGDWNDRLTDEGQANVFATFLEAPDRFSFTTLPLAEDGQFSFVPSRSFIDHVLVAGSDAATLVPRDTEVVRLDETVPDYVERISDHLPILSRFGLRPVVD
jgi:endonuclease/exonuclease/phosphatase family metal-dependent hydrolase